MQCGIHRYDGCMATYTIHMPPDAREGERDRFIRDGVALLALLIPAIWLLWHRLWFTFVAYMLIVASIASYGIIASDPSSTILSAIPGIFLFLEGNQLRRRKLEQAGWSEVGLVEADSLEDAELRWYGRDELANEPLKTSEIVSQQWTRTSSGTVQGAGPVIGIFGDEPAR